MKSIYQILILFILLSASTCFGQTTTIKTLHEGYYSKGWENSSFYEKKDTKILKPVWLGFDKSLQIADSLKVLLTSSKKCNGVFIMLEGVKRSGGNFGHLGAYSSEIIVTKILFVDTNNTLEKINFKALQLDSINTASELQNYNNNDSLKTKEFETKKGMYLIPCDNYTSIDTVIDNTLHCSLGQPNKVLRILCNPNSNACAIAKGVIKATKKINDEWVVLVSHGNYISVYPNLDSVYVRENQIVNERQNLGKILTIDNETILEFQLWKSQNKVEPLNWVSRKKKER